MILLEGRLDPEDGRKITIALAKADEIDRSIHGERFRALNPFCKAATSP